jgi:membrane protein
VAFYVILSLLPLVMGTLAFLAFFTNTADLQAQLVKFFQDNLPSSVDNLQVNFTRIESAKGALGLFGVIGNIWTGINIFSTLDDAINRAWGVTNFRPIVRAKLVETGMAVGCCLLLLFSMGFSAILQFFPRLHPLLSNGLVQTGGYLASFILMFVLLLVTYKVFPNTKTTWREVVPGAILAAVVFEIARQLFYLFAGNIADLTVIYGSLTTVILFLMWVYYAAMVTLVGAIFTVELGKLRREIHEGKYQVIKPGTTSLPCLKEAFSPFRRCEESFRRRTTKRSLFVVSSPKPRRLSLDNDIQAVQQRQHLRQ